MKLNFVIIIFVVLCIVGTVQAYDGYSNVTNFTVNASSAGAQTLYTLKFTVSNTSGISGNQILYTNGTTKGDWSDIEFSLNGVKIGYWHEPQNTNATSTIFDVNFPTISTSNNSVYSFAYGNSSATSGESIYRAFTANAADDIPSSTLNSTVWAVTGSPAPTVATGVITINAGSGDHYLKGTTDISNGGNYRIRWYGKTTSESSGTLAMGSAGDTAMYYGASVISQSGGVKMISDAWGATTTLTNDYNYHTYELVHPSSGSWILYKGGVNAGSVAGDNTNAKYLSWGGGGTTTGTMTLNWVGASKYASPEPVTYGYLTASSGSVVTPVASFTANMTSATYPIPVQFTDTSSNTPTGWNWSFTNVTGNNTQVWFSTSQNPVQNFGYGNFSIVLNATNDGGYNLSYQTTFINISSEGAPPIDAAFTQSPNPSTPGQQVNFTDTSTGSPDTWLWSITTLAGSYIQSNTTQNFDCTFTSAGTYNVSLTATESGNLSNTDTTFQHHTVTNVTSFTQQDIWMTAQYILRIHVVDSNNLPIVSATMVDSGNGNTYSTTNGTIYATYPFQAVVGVVSSAGYQSRQFSTFVDQDTDVTVQLVVAPVNSTPSQNTWWTPHTVQITLMDASYGFRLTDVQISATYNESSMPTNWVSDLYGIQAQVGADMVNRTLVLGGTTGSDGTLTTTMLGSIKYDIFLTSAQYGLTNYHVQAYPSDPMLNIYVATAGSVLPTNKNSTYVGLNGTRVYMTEPDIHNVTMCIDYVDTTGLTSSVTDTWMFQNNDTVFNTVTFSPGTSLNTSCYTLPNIRGTMVYWGYNATRGI